MSAEAPKRGIGGIAVGIFLIIGGMMASCGGFAGSIFGTVQAVQDVIKDHAQTTAPGKCEFTVPEAGTYAICHDHAIVYNDKQYSTAGQGGDLVCKVTEKATGTPVAVRNVSGSFTYNQGSRHGSAALQFDAPRPGTYVLEASYPKGSTSPEIVISVKRGFGKQFGTVAYKMIVSILIIFVGVALFVTGVAVLIVALVRRKKDAPLPDHLRAKR